MLHSRLIASSLAVALAAFAGQAFAADMPVKAPPPVVYPWTGWYVGANAGYAWSRNSLDSVGTPGPCDPAAGGNCPNIPNYSTLSAIGSTFSVPLNTRGFIGGGQFGWNQQFTNFVAGFETDLQGLSNASNSVTFASTVPSPPFPGSPLTQTATVSRSLDYLGTLRARAGFLAAPSFLIYGTGGLAYGSVQTSTTIAQGCIACVFFGVPSTTGTFHSTRVGYAAGAGVEAMLAPGWSAKLEYLHYDLGTATNTLPQLQGFNGGGAAPGPLFMSSTAVTSTRFSGDIVRFGINYQFWR